MHRRDALIACALSTGLVALLAPLASLGIDPHHDGIMLKPALDVLGGQVLFRDTFTQYGALTTYLQVMALWFQPTLLALRLLTLAAYAVTLFFLYAAWRLILPRSLTIVGCSLFILFIPCYEYNWLNEPWLLLPWSSVYALMFQSLAQYALLNIIRHEQPERWGMMLGMSAACVFWCRQPVGVMTAGCLIVIGLALHWTGWTPETKSRRAILRGILGGFLGVHTLLLVKIWLSDAGQEWWYQNFEWPRKFAVSAANEHWRAYSKMFLHPVAVIWLLVFLLAVMLPGSLKRFGVRLSPRLVLAYYACLGLALVWQHERVLPVLDLWAGGWTGLLPVAVMLQALGSIWLGFNRSLGPKSTEYYLIAASAALSLSSLMQYYPVPDSWHIVWALAPTFGLIIYTFWRWSGWPAFAVALVLFVVFLPSVYRKIQSGQKILSLPYVTLTHPAVLRGMRIPPAKARGYEHTMSVLDRILKEYPNIPSALIGNDALYLCLTNNRTNPLPYYVTWAALTDQAGNIQRVTYIQNVRPLLFFHKANWTSVNDFYRKSRYVPLAYITNEALEIAVPQELADAMGVTAYGFPEAEAAQGSPH